MTPPFSVAVTDYIDNPILERTVLQELARVDAWMATDESEILERAASVHALLVCHSIQLTEKSLAHLPECRVIVRCGVGVDNVDVRAAGGHGIVVCNVPDYGTEDVADHALMLILALTRRLLPCHHSIAAGNWDPLQAIGAPRLRGRALGVIGCGRIGTALALRAQALGMRVTLYDPYQPSGYEKALGIERASRLDELMRQSEIVSVHCPLNEETHHLINAESIALLPKGAYLVNTARGGCVDLDAVHAALESEQLAGAALDVTDPEPLAHEALRRHPRALFTPHVAYYTVEGLQELRTKAVQEVARALRGEPVWNPVNEADLVHPRCALRAR